MALGTFKILCNHHHHPIQEYFHQPVKTTGSDTKESSCNAGDLVLIPAPVFLPGEFHGQRNLEGCSPWDLEESDTTEWFSLSLSYSVNGHSLFFPSSQLLVTSNLYSTSVNLPLRDISYKQKHKLCVIWCSGIFYLAHYLQSWPMP